MATSFANPELVFVYYAERVNLAPADEVLLRNVQKSTIDSWVRLATSAWPGLTGTQARFRVHAAMALVVDVGRLVRYDDFRAFAGLRAPADGTHAARFLRTLAAR